MYAITHAKACNGNEMHCKTILCVVKQETKGQSRVGGGKQGMDLNRKEKKGDLKC